MTGFARRGCFLVFVAGLLVGILLWWPASWLAGWLPAGVSCSRWTGRLWTGGCEGLAIDGSRSGDVAWSLKAPRWNSLTLPLQLTWSAGTSRGSATLLVGFRGVAPVVRGMDDVDLSVSLQDVRNALPTQLRLGAVASFDGRLETRGLRLNFDESDRLVAAGALRIRGARYLRGNSPLGDLLARFPDGAITDLGGPLRIEGRVEFAPARAYRADLRVEARSASLAQALGIAAPFEIKFEGRL